MIYKMWDLVLKTRRRKGLGDQIAVSKYLDDEFVVSACSFFVIVVVWLFMVILCCVACAFGLGPCGSVRIVGGLTSLLACSCSLHCCVINATRSILSALSRHPRNAIL